MSNLDLEIKNQYLTDVVLPGFSGLNYTGVDSIIFDTEGVIIAASATSARNFNMENQEQLIGLSYGEASPELVQKVCDITPRTDINLIVELCHKVYKLQQIAIQEKITVTYIDVIPYKNSYEAFMVNNVPVCHPNGEVVALQMLSSPFFAFGLYDYLQLALMESPAWQESGKLCTDPLVERFSFLTQREHEILYLLAIGISQEGIAQLLSISRGTVSRFLTDKLCPKFGIYGANTKLLLEKVEKLDIKRHIPQSLFQPRIVILDQEIIKKYFAG